MAQFDVNLRDLYRVLRRRLRIFLLVPLLMGLATFFFTEEPPPIYQAESLVKVTRSSTLAGLMVDMISYSAYDNMATQVMVATSQPVLQEVARRISRLGEPGDIQEIIDRLKGQLSAEQRGTSDIITIKASASTPAQSILLANTTAEVYVQQSSAEKEKRLSEMVQFVRRRVDETTQELNETEQKLSDLKRANALSLALNPTQSVEIQEKRFQYQQKLKNAKMAQDTLSQIQKAKNYSELLEFYVSVEDDSVRALTDEITKRVSNVIDLQNRLADLLRYQTKQSPQVIQTTSQLANEAARLEIHISNLIQRLKTYVSEYTRLDRTLSQQQSELLRQPEVLTQLDSLQSVVKQKQDSLAGLRKQFQDAEIQYKEKVDDLAIVEKAYRTSETVPSGRRRIVIIGVLIGFFIGGIFAFVMESLDTSIGTIEDTEKLLGTPVLGVIPHIDLQQARDRLPSDLFPTQATEEDLDRFARLATHFDPSSVVSEAYRTLRTHLSSIMEKSGTKLLLITSSALQEGKTTAATNLAVAWAQTGRRVLLIDADLRRPSIDKIFAIDRSPGFTDVLLGTQDLKGCCRNANDLIVGKFGLKAVQLTAGMEYLFILPSGRNVDNPSELLDAMAMNRLLDEARGSFDMTILDMAPILPVADASIVAPKVDGVILSYQIGRIGRDLLKRSKSRLESLGANIWGIILNDIQAEIDYWGSEYSQYHYRYNGERQRKKSGWAAWGMKWFKRNPHKKVR